METEFSLPNELDPRQEKHYPLHAVKLTHQSIESLFLEHCRKLIQWLYRIVRCKETAADLAQEAYLRLIAVAGTQSITYPRAFLFRTAKNLALDHIRKGKSQLRPVATLDEAIHVPSEAPSAEQLVFDKQRLSVFLAAINGLPPRCREVFILHRVHDRSYQEIALRLGISESAVEKSMMRALTYCRRALQETSTA